MIHIGGLIESRRRHLGLSRLQLASRLGVSSQTVLNLERDPTYNLGTSLLQRLEQALQVTFDITMKEQRIMSTRIQMGNDEFILYIRKNHPSCATSNDRLGSRIWKWIYGSDPTAEQVGGGESVPCFWGATAANIDETKLPKTATQFQFERRLLPELYDHLDALGSGLEQNLAASMPLAAL
jgi:transcriptional regulator with XRE-family HTH domain